MVDWAGSGFVSTGLYSLCSNLVVCLLLAQRGFVVRG